MDTLVDFEALININEILVSMEKIEGEIQDISQKSLFDALDKMNDEGESKNTEVITAHTDTKLTIEENTGSPDDVINLDDFGDIFNGMQMSVDALKTLEQKEFTITDTITDYNTEILEERINRSVDDNNISEIIHSTDDISENDPVVNLNEFEMIFNDICVSNNKIENESILSDTKIRKKETVTSLNIIDLDKIEDTVNDDKDTNDKNKIVTENLKPYGECSLENKSTETLKLNDTENNLTTDLDETESDTDCNKGDNLKTIVSKQTGIKTLNYESEDDGYNSSDFELITESEAKKKCLAKTNIQNYSYYNADYMKYHKNRYLPCKAISSKAERESHIIPQGESYLDLFRGMYAPAVMNNLYYASKKRVLSVTSMTIQEDCGFDVYENHCEENEEYKNEANESLKRILFLYPDENRKRRRSRRF